MLGKRTSLDERAGLPFKKGTGHDLFDTVKRNSWESCKISRAFLVHVRAYMR